MASIRKRGENSYLLSVSMGYDGDGRRRSPKEKTVHPPADLTPKAKEKWLQEEAALFERQVKNLPTPVQKDIKLKEYVRIWLQEIAPKKLAKTTLERTYQDINRFILQLGGIKLTELRPEHFRNLYAELRSQISERTGKPFSEHTIEGVHSALCGILSDAMAAGYIQSNPAWRTYKPIAKKQKRTVADEETAKKLLVALEQEDMKYEVYYTIILMTGIRRGECCGIQWGDIDWNDRSIHICRNVVKITGEELFVKSPKTAAGDRYVYISGEMVALLERYREHCEREGRHPAPLTPSTYLFRKRDREEPMSPDSFTVRFRKILKAHGLPLDLNVHSLRHTNASLLIANGTDVATVAGLLGHSQISTTLDIYAHSFDTKRREASQVLQERLTR